MVTQQRQHLGHGGGRTVEVKYVGALKGAAGCGNETLRCVCHIHKAHIAGEGDGVGLSHFSRHQSNGRCGAHTLVAAGPVNNGGANTDARYAPVLPIHGGHLFAANLVGTVEGGQPVVVAHGGRRNGAGIAHACNTALPGELQHVDAAHDVDARTADGVGLAKGHLQRGEVNDGLDVMCFGHLQQAVKIGDVAQLPDH